MSIADIRQGNVWRRRNPLVAELFRRIQMVEAWGRGMPLILANAPAVEFSETAGLFISSFARPSYRDDMPSPSKESESRPESLESRVLRVLQNGPLSKAELSQKLGQKTVSGTLNQLVRSLVTSGKVAYTLPEKPNSRLQKYKLNKGPTP